MNRIEKLIEEMCPEGVPKYRLDEVFEIRGGYTPSKSKPELWDPPGIPWFRMEDIRIHGRVLDYSTQYISHMGVKRSGPFSANSIIISDTATIGEHALITVPFAANQQFSILELKQSFASLIDMKFAFYMGFSLGEYCRKNTSKGGYPTLVKTALYSWQFPVPPLEIQKEIVNILDKFTQLEAELEAELEAREKEYEEVRRRLLDFESDTSNHPLGEMIREMCAEGVAVKPLGSIVSNRDRERKPVTRSQRADGEFPYYGANGIQDYVDSYIFDGTFLLVGEDGSVVKDNGTPYLNWAEGKIWVNNHAHVLQQIDEAANLRFVFHFLSTTDIKEFVTGGSQKKINQGNLNKIPIAVPPLEIQKEIVRILDNLDSLVNSVNEGIPAEIAARRKQYEYYRDKLLTFKELDVA